MTRSMLAPNSLYLNAQIANDEKHSLDCSIKKAHVQDIKEFLHHANNTEQVL